MHDILASLLERVKANEKSIGGDFPLVGTLSLALIFEVSILELGTSLESKGKLVVSFLGLLILDAAENSLAINVFTALADNGIANLADEDDKAGRSVVVRGIGPDHQDHMHDGDKEIRNLSELLT